MTRSRWGCRQKKKPRVGAFSRICDTDRAASRARDVEDTLFPIGISALERRGDSLLGGRSRASCGLHHGAGRELRGELLAAGARTGESSHGATKSIYGVDPDADADYTVRVDGTTIPAGFGGTSAASIPATVSSDGAATDVDFGFGYSYEVIVEDASVQVE